MGRQGYRCVNHVIQIGESILFFGGKWALFVYWLLVKSGLISPLAQHDFDGSLFAVSKDTQWVLFRFATKPPSCPCSGGQAPPNPPTLSMSSTRHDRQTPTRH